MEYLLAEPVRVVSGQENYRTHIAAGVHTLFADEPTDLGGADTAASPYQLLLASLGSCTVITLQMYAQRKGWLVSVQVELNLRRDADSTYVERRVALQGALDEAQRERLLQVAKACPVAKILSGSVQIESALAVFE